MSSKPNILWFVADQMRCDSMAHMGNPAASTPNLDALATEGVTFDHAYCQNPVCVPSRCSFLTGLYPHTLGHRTMHFMMRKDDPNIMKTMKANGYEVIWIGRNDFIPSSWAKTDYCDQFYDGTDLIEKSALEGGAFHPGMRGDAKPEIAPVMQDAQLKYSFYLGKFPEHSLDRTFDWNCVNAALNYLDERSRQPHEKPFFIYCTLSFPHPPYGCEEPWYSLIDRSKCLVHERRAVRPRTDADAVLFPECICHTCRIFPGKVEGDNRRMTFCRRISIHNDTRNLLHLFVKTACQIPLPFLQFLDPLIHPVTDACCQPCQAMDIECPGFECRWHFLRMVFIVTVNAAAANQKRFH